MYNISIYIYNTSMYYLYIASPKQPGAFLRGAAAFLEASVMSWTGQPYMM